MILGSIKYLNTLSFKIFLKKYIKSSQLSTILRNKIGVPSLINQNLKKRKLDIAFISSVESFKYKCLKIGITSKREIYSVFVINGEDKKDIESSTSNRVASILNLKGKVIIGDKALKYYLNGGEGVDIGKAWFDKTKLPCVFARVCFLHKKKIFYRIEKAFLNQKIKIPHYIFEKESKKHSLSIKEIKWYLSKIKFKIDSKEEKSLKILSKKINYNIIF